VSLSTHVLDAARGRPAAGVPVRWETRAADGSWTLTAAGVTDADGRVTAPAWHPGAGAPTAHPGAGTPTAHPGAGAPTALGVGRHRLVFDVAAWAASAEAEDFAEPFFPEVTITFAVSDASAAGHHHVPLLLSPYAYSTYRGS
jgi:5-hydroxyisourate hydrolase